MIDVTIERGNYEVASSDKSGRLRKEGEGGEEGRGGKRRGCLSVRKKDFHP